MAILGFDMNVDQQCSPPQLLLRNDVLKKKKIRLTSYPPMIAK